MIKNPKNKQEELKKIVPVKMMRSFLFLILAHKIPILSLICFLSSGIILGLPAEIHASDKYALVIGINEYYSAKVTDLRYAVNDAETIEELLIQELGYDKDNVKLLTNSYATRRHILEEYYRLKKRMSEKSEFILFFAGHGVRDRSVKSDKGWESYWMTFMADLTHIEIEGIRLIDVMRLVHSLPARRRLIILDHCYAGDLDLNIKEERRYHSIEVSGARTISQASHDPKYRQKIIPDALPYNHPNDRNLINSAVWTPLPEDKITAIIAAARDEAYEHDKLNHGLLTWAINKSLTSDKAIVDAWNDNKYANGTITLRELALYLKEITEKMKEELLIGGLTAIERQNIKAVIDYENQAISGWQLLKISGRADLNQALEYLKILRELGLKGLPYYGPQTILEEAKKQIVRNGKISKDNCLCDQMINLVINTQKDMDEKGGVNADDIGAVKKIFISGYGQAQKQCEK